MGVAATGAEVLTQKNSSDGLLDIRRLGRLERSEESVLIETLHDHDAKGNHFIVGIEMHKYWRYGIRCDQCEKYSCCDRCIGNTNNGYYDVTAMVTSPVEVDINRPRAGACAASQIIRAT